MWRKPAWRIARRPLAIIDRRQDRELRERKTMNGLLGARRRHATPAAGGHWCLPQGHRHAGCRRHRRPGCRRRRAEEEVGLQQAYGRLRPQKKAAGANRRLFSEVSSRRPVQPRCPAGRLARKAWICDTTAAPSPTAAATRLVELARTSPMANTPGTLVSRAARAGSSGG